MQTLNVSAGQSDAEYQASSESRRQELRSEAEDAANYFFGAAGLAALATGLLTIRVNIFVSLGLFDLLHYYGRSLSHFVIVWYVLALLWVGGMAGLGLAGRKLHRWAFLLGLAIYAADMLALIVTFSIWSFAVHGIFMYKWFKGQSALKDLRDSEVQSSAA